MFVVLSRVSQNIAILSIVRDVLSDILLCCIILTTTSSSLSPILPLQGRDCTFGGPAANSHLQLLERQVRVVAWVSLMLLSNHCLDRELLLTCRRVITCSCCCRSLSIWTNLGLQFMQDIFCKVFYTCT